jgi:hypothetical protein
MVDHPEEVAAPIEVDRHEGRDVGADAPALLDPPQQRVVGVDLDRSA